MDRRNFFKSVARGGIFSALAGTSIYLISREKVSGGKTCNFDFICQNCKKTSHCQLPEASNYRKEKFLNR